MTTPQSKSEKKHDIIFFICCIIYIIELIYIRQIFNYFGLIFSIIVLAIPIAIVYVSRIILENKSH